MHLSSCLLTLSKQTKFYFQTFHYLSYKTTSAVIPKCTQTQMGKAISIPTKRQKCQNEILLLIISDITRLQSK